MIEFKRLKSLIYGLSNKEKTIVERFFYYKDIEDNDGSPSSKLFRLILSDKNISQDIISVKLYGISNNIALRKLVQRLIDRILEIISSKEVLVEGDIHGIRSIEIFSIRRKMLFYDVLVAHGLKGHALSILDQIISICREIEYYDYLIIALNKKLVKNSLQFGLNAFNRVYKELEFYSELNIVVKRSHYLLRMYSSDFEFKSGWFNNDQLKATIDSLKYSLKRFDSKTLKINIFYLEGIYYFNLNKYLLTLKKFKELYKYLNLNRSVGVKNSFLMCLLNIAECETQLYNFESSTKYLQNVVNKFNRNEYNHKLVNEMMFYNYYYSGQLEKSIIVLDELVLFSEVISPFLVAKWKFFKASILTVTEKYSDSNLVLLKCNELDKDRTNYNVGVRILSIINNIELGKLMYAETQIENLRKHISRVSDTQKSGFRFNIISKILIKLANESFDFENVLMKCKSDIVKIKSGGTNYLWTLKGPEMLIFHEWFEAKAKGVQYDHTQVMKRLKKAHK